MSSKKLLRAWGAVRIRYPIFQAIRAHRALFFIIGTTFIGAFFYSIMWAFNVPQDALKISAITDIPDNLFSTIIEVTVFLFLGIGLLLWKTIAASENMRINTSNSEIQDFLVFPVAPSFGVEMAFDSGMHYSSPPILEACLRWVEFDRDEFFLVEAGSLDIPKLTLKKIIIDNESNKLRLELGTSSFYDIFYTHYSPDLVLSSQSVNEVNSQTTLRSLFGKSICTYYQKQIDSKPKSQATIECTHLLPNPLGISGIVLLNTTESSYVLLRKRSSHEIAAKNRLEWSFAGLIEATEWIHESEIDFLKFAKTELEDEVLAKAQALSLYTPEIETLGFVFNPLYLYQPEIFVVVNYSLNRESFSGIKNELINSFVLVTIDRLSDAFKTHELKNLCLPGLKLLNAAYPSLFPAANTSLNSDAPTSGAPVS